MIDDHVPDKVSEKIATGMSISSIAEEINVPKTTLYDALRKRKTRIESKKERRKPGPKPKKITVVDLKSFSSGEKALSIPELLAGIDFNVSQIKKILGVK